MLTLAVLVRAPGRLEPLQGGRGLAEVPAASCRVSASRTAEYRRRRRRSAGPRSPLADFRLPVDAGHFLRQAAHLDGRQAVSPGAGKVSLPVLPDKPFLSPGREVTGRRESSPPWTAACRAISRRSSIATCEDFEDLDLSDGAVLVVNHQTDEILAWVNGGGSSGTTSGAGLTQ